MDGEAAGLPPADIGALISHQARELSARLQAHRLELFPPAARKTLRPFSAAEAARLLRIEPARLRALTLGTPAPDTPGRRSYPAAEIRALRERLGAAPCRRDGEHMQVVAVMNFKGGSGKTTTAAHLAQHLALSGHRVLAVDLDPQASLSALHGFQPELDIGPNETLYGALRYDDDARPLAELVRPTNFPGLDIVPANIELTEFEYDTPRILAARGMAGSVFLSRLDTALSGVADRYDVAVVDCPPQLGYLSMAALCTATAVLVTIHPQMLDVMSMCQFLLLMGDVVAHLAEAGAPMRFDWLRYLVTRYEPADGAQAQLVAFMRSLFGGHVLANPMLKSVAVSDAGITKQTLYEVQRRQFTPATYDRALECLDAVNGEIEALIHAAWGRGAGS